jgi:hypothetical protein
MQQHDRIPWLQRRRDMEVMDAETIIVLIVIIIIAFTLGRHG